VTRGRADACSRLHLSYDTHPESEGRGRYQGKNRIGPSGLGADGF